MNDSPQADESRDDFILQERLSGRFARSISKELHCSTADVDASLDRTLPKITNEAKRRMAALDLDRLDGLIEVFYKRAIEKVDAQAGLLVVKILERKAALLGLDSPQKLDIVQVQQAPSSYDRITSVLLSLKYPNGRPNGDGDAPPTALDDPDREPIAIGTDRERDSGAT